MTAVGMRAGCFSLVDASLLAAQRYSTCCLFDISPSSPQMRCVVQLYKRLLRCIFFALGSIVSVALIYF